MIPNKPNWLSRISKAEIVNIRKPIPILFDPISQKFPKIIAVGGTAESALESRKS